MASPATLAIKGVAAHAWDAKCKEAEDSLRDDSEVNGERASLASRIYKDNISTSCYVLAQKKEDLLF